MTSRARMLRLLRGLFAMLLVPAFAVCGTEPENDIAGPTDAGVPNEGGEAAPTPGEAGAADGFVTPLDGSVSVDAGDASSNPDVSVDADANVAPSIGAYLAFCYQSASGGRAAVYGIDDLTGALLRVDQDPADAGLQDFPSGQNTIFSAISPARGALYCARSIAPGINPSVGAFAIGDGGVLSSRTSGSMPKQPVGVAVLPSGDAVYALSNTISAEGIYRFPVALNGGVSTGAYSGWAQYSEQLLVDRLGRFIFAAGGGTLWVHHVDASDAGALTLAPFHKKDGGGFASFYVGDLGTARRWAAHPTVNALYGAFGLTSNKLVAFGYDGTTGALAKLNEAPADAEPAGVVVHPNGEHAYVVHKNAATIGHYQVAVDGTLSGRTVIAIPTPATVVTMDPTGKYLYAGTASELRGYAVAANGGLTALSAAPITGVFPGDLPTIAKP